MAPSCKVANASDWPPFLSRLETLVPRCRDRSHTDSSSVSLSPPYRPCHPSVVFAGSPFAPSPSFELLAPADKDQLQRVCSMVPLVSRGFCRIHLPRPPPDGRVLSGESPSHVFDHDPCASVFGHDGLPRRHALFVCVRMNGLSHTLVPLIAQLSVQWGSSALFALPAKLNAFCCFGVRCVCFCPFLGAIDGNDDYSASIHVLRRHLYDADAMIFFEIHPLIPYHPHTCEIDGVVARASFHTAHRSFHCLRSNVGVNDDVEISERVNETDYEKGCR